MQCPRLIAFQTDELCMQHARQHTWSSIRMPAKLAAAKPCSVRFSVATLIHASIVLKCQETSAKPVLASIIKVDLCLAHR